MTIDELLETIDDHLQKVNDDIKERVKRIDGILDFLNYNRRLTLLSPEEKQDFYYCNEGYPIEGNLKKAIDKCKTEKEKNYYIDMWARTTYFRQCAWLNYLYGNTQEKPPISTKKI
jgi:hypothetical protein